VEFGSYFVFSVTIELAEAMIEERRQFSEIVREHREILAMLSKKLKA
jgi:hypothetical protein